MILKKIFFDRNKRYLKKIQPLVKKINSLEPFFEKLSDFQLKEKTFEFKKRLKEGQTLDDILPEAFALVREAAKRTLGQRHFDVQLMGGIALYQGKVVEMKTGEGKTLTATLPLYLKALEGKGCHLVTVNDYLARRDTVWMGQIYYLLGLSVGCLNHEQSFLYDPEYKKPAQEKEKLRDELGSFYVVEDFLRPCLRKEAYLADITYGTNHEFGFDYLKDNMVLTPEDIVGRDLWYAIVDEVDSILIDEARTPLIISLPDQESSLWYKEFSKIVPKLEKEKDYEVDEKLKIVNLTEEGIDKIEKILGLSNIYDQKGIRYLHHLEQALKAEIFFKKDRDYIIKDGKIIIVDEFTGRLMPGRRWSGGLHQAIEAKEGVEVLPESITLASITFQNYFRMYKKLAGMTGTAFTAQEEFFKVYGLETVVIPPNKPMIRKDLPDRIYKTEKEKFQAIIEQIKKIHQKGQPILVGTRSVEKNEYLSFLLKKEGIPHQVLNAKNHQKEGEIIAQAGRLGAITIATNMAGRGVDIILGGNPPILEEKEKIIKLGGLFVIGTERHEDRRIDNQLRGRAGRQGDPGVSQFFISLEDELIRIFGGEKIKILMEKFNFPAGQPIESKMVSNLIESAQKKVEGMNLDLRKNLLEFDDVMAKHREKFYSLRKDILFKEKNDIKDYILEIFIKHGYDISLYLQKEKEIEPDQLREIERLIILKFFDSFWQVHLEEMEILRNSVNLRVYGGQDPLVEYKIEGNKKFKELMQMIEKSIIEYLIKLSFQKKEQKFVSFSEKKEKKLGRNDPCPCGRTDPETKKPIKYKKCCWPKYGY